MKTKQEFNLSEKIRDLDSFLEYEDILTKEDVKEFVRLLKENFSSTKWVFKDEYEKIIDKLAGEELR